MFLFLLTPAQVMLSMPQLAVKALPAENNNRPCTQHIVTSEFILRNDLTLDRDVFYDEYGRIHRVSKETECNNIFPFLTFL